MIAERRSFIAQHGIQPDEGRGVSAHDGAQQVQPETEGQHDDLSGGDRLARQRRASGGLSAAAPFAAVEWQAMIDLPPAEAEAPRTKSS